MPTSQPSKYIDPKALDRIKRLDVRARLVVEGFITGQHKSPYQGFAVEFAGHREYVPGDEIKHIDWKLWSRTDRLFIKEYEEETNLKCQMILDASKSMRYGDKSGWSKFDYAATAAASLAFLLQQQQDAVGLITFNTDILEALPASSSPGHLKRLLHVMQELEPDDKTDVGEVFPKLSSKMRQRGIVAIFSDFFVDLDILKKTLQEFRLRKHEVILFHVMHEDELEFPFEENTLFKGLETMDELQTQPRDLRKSYLKVVAEYLSDVRKMCSSCGIDHVLMNTSDPLDAALAAYLAFRQRNHRSVRY
jgi:uncharacterized protein (DUF58 family)